MKKTLLFSALLTIVSLNTKAQTHYIQRVCEDKTYDAFVKKEDGNIWESFADFLTPTLRVTECDYKVFECSKFIPEITMDGKKVNSNKRDSGYFSKLLKSASCEEVYETIKKKPASIKENSTGFKLRYCLAKLEGNLINILKAEKECHPHKHLEGGVMNIIPLQMDGNDNISLQNIAKDPCFSAEKRLKA